MISRSDATRREYVARVNRVLDYIWTHTQEELTPEKLADVACFSRFHFHRIFLAMTGETISELVRRVRLERAAGYLMSDKDRPITDIALDCGFSSPSVFARAFKEKFRMSASEWRDGGWSRYRKERKLDNNPGQALRTEGQAESNGGEAQCAGLAYPPGSEVNSRRRDMAKLKYTVEVKDLPELNVAYVRHVGPYHEVGEAFGRLMKWAGPRGLLGKPESLVLAIYHDNPDVTDVANLRSSACVAVPKGTQVGGEIGTMTVPGGKFAVGRFEIDGTQFKDAWQAVDGEWLPSSGYQTDDRMCYEIYINDHETHPEKKFIIDICEPVKPL